MPANRFIRSTQMRTGVSFSRERGNKEAITQVVASRNCMGTIHDLRLPKRAEDRRDLRVPRRLWHRDKTWQCHGRKNGDDAYRHDKLDQGETA